MTGLPESVGRHTVLVVDDAPDNLMLMSAILKEKYQVKVARSGQQALDIIFTDKPPDLVLLDVRMPEMDGFEVMRRLDTDVRSKDIPVIFLTAMTEVTDEEAGLALGAVDYLAKPVKPAVVLARVSNHIMLAERTRMLRELSGKLSRYLPPQVYQRIFEGAQDTTIYTRRKKLTIFFSDIKDFTSTTEDLEPEDLNNLLNKYFDEMSKIAFEHGATIDKFVGDAMMMFFGDPESHGVKEDALHCVHMAIAMQRRMADLQSAWRDEGYENPLRMRIGINTGFCNVGNFGSTQRMDYTAIGSEVNLAARLEQASDPDGILMSFETYALVQDEITGEERPPVALKGIAGGIRSFAVTNILENIGTQRRYVQKVRPGLRAVLDMDSLPPAGRDEAIGDLQELIERIRRPDSEK